MIKFFVVKPQPIWRIKSKHRKGYTHSRSEFLLFVFSMTNKPNLVMMTPQVLSVPHLPNLIIVYKNKGLGQLSSAHRISVIWPRGPANQDWVWCWAVASGRQRQEFLCPPLPPCQQCQQPGNMSLFSSTNQSCHTHCVSLSLDILLNDYNAENVILKHYKCHSWHD